MMFYGIDIGTTSVGAVAIDEAERLVVSATCPHAADVAGLGAGVDEQDPAKLLSAVRSARRRATIVSTRSMSGG